MAKEIKFSLVYRDMWQSSGRYVPRVDQLVKAREHTVKRERSKIGNSAYKNQGRGKPFPNTFRWETVRTMVNEIRNPQ